MSATSGVQEVPVVDLGALLDAGDGAVVTLIAGETRLVAHRAVLAARSPVLSAMFQHETQEATSGEATIKDVEGPVLRQLLGYCYTLQAPQLPDMAAQLLVAADEYQLLALKAACEQQLATQLAVETAAATAVLAVRHSCPSLTAAAIAFVKDNLVSVVVSQGWADAAITSSKDIAEVRRLLGELLAESRTPAAATPGPHHQPHSDHGSRAPATAAAPMAPHPAALPDDADISLLRSLSQEERNSRLIEAAEEGAVPELRALLAAGADVGAREEAGVRWTALHSAAYRGHEEAARCLVEAGAEVDARDDACLTPLHRAAARGHAAVVELLLAASARPNAWDACKRTPLYRAAESGHAAVVQLLLAKSADPNDRDEQGRTPLHMAAECGEAAVVRMLLAASADPNARDQDGWTPLHWAADNGRAEAAAALLEWGADRAATDDDGRTPLDLARRYNDQQLIQLLTP